MGQNIINDIDPNITNINQNIKTLKTTAHIDTAFSRCDIHDTIPQALRRTPSIMMVGNFEGGTTGNVDFRDTAMAYIEFRPTIFRQSGWEIVRNPLKDTLNNIIDSVVFKVQRFRDSIIIPQVDKNYTVSIDVFSCDTIKDSVLFNFNKKSNPSRILSTFDTMHLDSLGIDSIYSIKLDSVFYTKKIRSAVSDTGSDTSWFAFFMKPSPNSNNGVVRLYGNTGVTGYDPRLMIYYHKKGDTTVQSQTLPRHHASVSIFGPYFSSDSSKRTESPVSFSGTNRRAVFKLDVTSLKTFIVDSAPAGKQFVVLQRADLSLKVDSAFADLRRDSLLVYYNVSDTVQSQSFEFKKVNSFYVKTGSHDTAYTLSLANWLQPIIVNRKSSSVYVYLSLPVSTQPEPFEQVVWRHSDAELKLNAIFTNPR